MVKIKTTQQANATRAVAGMHPDDHAAALAAFQAPQAQAAQTVTSGTVVPPNAAEFALFSVGGCSDCGGKDNTSNDCGGPPSPPVCRPTSINDCYHEVAKKYRCPLKVTAGGIRGVLAQQSFRFAVQPVQSNYFLPIAVRFIARQTPNLLLMSYALITAVSIKNMPQENYHNTTPNATTVQGVETDAYDGVTAGDVPGFEVAWGPFSREANAEQLIIYGWQPLPLPFQLDIRAEIWGYELSSLPQGWQCGKHPGKSEPVPAG